MEKQMRITYKTRRETPYPKIDASERARITAADAASACFLTRQTL